MIVARCAGPLLPLLLLTHGCGDSNSSWRGVIRDSAGIAIVENPSQPWVEEAPDAHEVLRIGSTEGDPATQFGLIASIAVAENGTIYVLDQQNRRVRVFNAAGGFVREMGRAGAGPGELSDFAVAVMLARADTVVVADPGNRRFTRFAPGGGPAGDFPMPFPPGTLPQRFAMLPDGRILEMARTESTPDRPELRDDVFVRVDRNGAIVDTIHRMPTSRSVRFEGAVMRFSAYDPEPHWTLDRQGQLYTGMTGEYRIEIRTVDGSLRSVVTREHSNQPITEADQRAFLNMLRRTLTDQHVDPALIAQMISGMSFAAHYPAFALFQPGPRGTLWVQRIRTATDAEREGDAFEATDLGDTAFDVFDAQGRFVAVVHLPARFVPLTYVGDQFYGMWRDDLDVQYVMAVEVVWAAAHPAADRYPAAVASGMSPR